jgi:hypothetical protein
MGTRNSKNKIIGKRVPKVFGPDRIRVRPATKAGRDRICISKE